MTDPAVKYLAVGCDSKMFLDGARAVASAVRHGVGVKNDEEYLLIRE